MREEASENKFYNDNLWEEENKTDWGRDEMKEYARDERT